MTSDFDEAHDSIQAPVNTPSNLRFARCPGPSSLEREEVANDILLNHQHVLIFASWGILGTAVSVYEARPFPVWRVNAAQIPTDYLLERGYQPWRYRGIRD